MQIDRFKQVEFVSYTINSDIAICSVCKEEFVLTVKNGYANFVTDQAVVHTLGHGTTQQGFVTPSNNLEQVDLVVFKRERFIATCTVCNKTFDLISETFQQEQVYHHVREHGATDMTYFETIR